MKKYSDDDMLIAVLIAVAGTAIIIGLVLLPINVVQKNKEPYKTEIINTDTFYYYKNNYK